MRPRRRRPLVPVAVLAVVLAFAAPALGDADPASDQLIAFDSYYPYSPQVSKPLQAQLDAILRATRKNGHIYKVVLIEAPPDLGAATVLYGKTQRYASFLYSEIHQFLSAQRPTYLILTKQGAALRGKDATRAGRAALAKISIPQNASSDQLAQTAIKAVPAIAAANGHPIPKSLIKASSPASPAKKSNAWLWVIAAVAIVVAGLAAAWLLREWHRTRHTTEAS